MLAIGFGFWEDWELQDKVVFNMFTRIIAVNPEVTSLDIKTDVYSAWKRWMAIDDNNKIGQVVRVIGGDNTSGGLKAGDIYFLVNGWRLQVDLSQTAVTGSLFSDDFDSPLIGFDGNPINQSLVSNLVTGLDVVAPTPEANALAVWSNAIRTLTESSALTTEQAAQLNSIPLNPVLTNDSRLDRGMTVDQESKLDAIPTNPVLDTDVRLDRGMTVGQESKLDAIPTTAAPTTSAIRTELATELGEISNTNLKVQNIAGDVRLNLAVELAAILDSNTRVQDIPGGVRTNLAIELAAILDSNVKVQDIDGDVRTNLTVELAKIMDNGTEIQALPSAVRLNLAVELAAILDSNIKVQDIDGDVRLNLATELAAILDSNTKIDSLHTKSDALDVKVDAVPQDVWDVPKTSTTTAGSIGEYISKKLVSLKEWYSR